MLTSAQSSRTPSAPVPAPRLSIVVVNWNTRDLLLALLGQLLPAGGPPLPAEIVVVDNDSADDSVDAASKAFPAARILRAPRNGGFAYGVNHGIAEARGEWILLLNTDTVVRWDEIEPTDLHRHTQHGMRALLEAAGFEVVDLQRRASIELGGFRFTLGYGATAVPR